MSLEFKRNTLIAETLQSIFNERFKQMEPTSNGKSLLCLEGFSREVFEDLKRMVALEVDVFWAGETKGEELVRQRNDPNAKKPLVIFTGSYFPESQSLEHFSRLTSQFLLEEQKYREKLINQAFLGIDKAKYDEQLIQEALKKIVNILQPSLNAMSDYLGSIKMQIDKNHEEYSEDFVYETMGKLLWKLGVFSYEKFITGNKRTRSYDSGELLRMSFETYQKHNLQYSSPGYRNRFTYERLKKINNPEQRKLLFNYARSINIEECLEKVDFEKVKDLLKKPKLEASKKPGKNETEDVSRNILESIFLKFQESNDFSCQFGDEEIFNISLSPILLKNALEPFFSFGEWNARLNHAIEEYRRDSNSDSTDDKDKIEISITAKDNESILKKEIFLLDLTGEESKKRSSGTEKWESLVKSSNETVIKESVQNFLKKRNEILSGNEIGKPGFVTLPLDIDGYIRSYLKLVNILWKNAEKCAEFEWFRNFLKQFVSLDFEKNDKGNLEILAAHPFQLFKQRLQEIIILELLEGVDENEKEDWKDYIKDIGDEVSDVFVRCWPRYFGSEEGKAPLKFNIDENDNGKVVFNAKTDDLPQKSYIEKTLNPQILRYVKENPLSEHGIRLKVLNPFKGKELFKAIETLYKKRNMKYYPQSVFLTAIGLNDQETLSFFDDRVEAMDKEEVDIFVKQSNKINPFCRYEKRLKKDRDWVNKWLDFNFTGQDEEVEEDSADIFFALDPFLQAYHYQDNKMPSQVSDAIDCYFESFENNELGVMELLSGPDRIYLRLALEALSIMAIKSSGERRNYDEKIVTIEQYVKLFDKMRKHDQWAILLDRNINDYYAERVADALEKEINETASIIIHDITQGGVYLFISPSHEQNAEIMEGFKKFGLINIDKRFCHWVAAVYQRFIEYDTFVNGFSESSYQWLIPLNLLPDWLIKWKEVENANNEEFDLPYRDLSSYMVRFIFRSGEEGNMDFGIFLYKIDSTGYRKADEEIEENTFDFLEIDRKNPSGALKKLKRRILFKTLLTLINNPFQSWCLALLNREEVNFKRGLNEADITNKEKTAIGQMKIWELRRLSTHLIKLYSPSPGISFDFALTLKSVFSGIHERIPNFPPECLGHLCEKNPNLFNEHKFLTNYLKNTKYIEIME